MALFYKRVKPKIYLIIDNKDAALITLDEAAVHHPFIINHYAPLPSSWFLDGSPWHVAALTSYINDFATIHRLHNPLLIYAGNGETFYEKTHTLTKPPSKALIPIDSVYSQYTWQTTSLFSSHNDESPITLLSGIPSYALFQLNLCSQKSGCIMHRATSIKTSLQPLYAYCYQHGITLENSEKKQEQSPLLSTLCSPLHNDYTPLLILSALGLFLYERSHHAT